MNQKSTFPNKDLLHRHCNNCHKKAVHGTSCTWLSSPCVSGSIPPQTQLQKGVLLPLWTQAKKTSVPSAFPIYPICYFPKSRAIWNLHCWLLYIPFIVLVFFFFLEIWLFWSYDFYKEVSALECSHLGNKNWKSGWEYWLNYHRHQNLTFSTKVCEISLPSGGTPVKPFPAAELRQHRLLPKQNRMVSLERRRPLAFSLPCGEDIGQVVFLTNWP